MHCAWSLRRTTEMYAFYCTVPQTCHVCSETSGHMHGLEGSPRLGAMKAPLYIWLLFCCDISLSQNAMLRHGTHDMRTRKRTVAGQRCCTRGQVLLGPYNCYSYSDYYYENLLRNHTQFVMLLLTAVSLLQHTLLSPVAYYCCCVWNRCSSLRSPKTSLPSGRLLEGPQRQWLRGPAQQPRRLALPLTASGKSSGRVRQSTAPSPWCVSRRRSRTPQPGR